MRAWWRTRWSFCLVIGIGLVLIGSAWWAVVRREMVLVGRYPGQISCAVPTEGGLLYMPASAPDTRILRGWDGRVRWRIALPPIDRAAWARWYPAYGGMAREDWTAPNGRVLAAVRMDARGARVLIWRDGRFCGAHRFPVQPGALFDGRHWYDLTVCNDGRIFVYNHAYPVGPVVLLRDERILARGEHCSTLRTAQEDFTRMINDKGDIWTSTFTPPTAHERLRLTTAGDRLTWSPLLPRPPSPPSRWKFVNNSYDGAELQRNGARLRVVRPDGTKSWLLPPQADTHATQAVVGTGGHSVLLVQAPADDAPLIRRMKDYLATLPGLQRLNAPPRSRMCYVYQEPGTLRACGRLPLFSDYWFFNLPDSYVFADPLWLSPDGRYLVAFAHGNKPAGELLFFKCW